MKLKPIKIEINGTPITVWHSPLTFSELIDLAGIEMSEEWRSTDGQRELHVSSGHSITIEKSTVPEP